MLAVGSADARARLPELLGRVEAGETVTVTRRGKPVARIVPVGRDRRAEVRAAIEQIRALPSRRRNVPVEEILSARHEGRRFLMSFVLDASIAAAWALQDESAPLATLDRRLVAAGQGEAIQPFAP